MRHVHILNGDSLKYQLQAIINDELIVTRECLIDGNVQGETLTDFYANRAAFTAQYDDCTVAGYYEKSATEIDKIANIEVGRQIICWFEDDLFCQANFWFVINLLVKSGHQENIYLVRPSPGNEYSFASMAEYELTLALKEKQALFPQQLKLLAELWPLYQQNDGEKMVIIAQQLSTELPFLLSAIKAHQCRIPDESGLGYPERQLLAVVAELNSTEFSAVFKCFSAREGIYSFGDMQVKQMFERLIESKKA